MALLSVQSGLIQTVQPSDLRIESFQSNSLGSADISGGEVVSENLKIAKPDTAAPINVAPYDGNSAFGLFIVDETLDGEAT